MTGEASAGAGRTQGFRRALDVGLGGCCTLLLAGLAGLTVLDVVGRYWFNAPISGAFEITQLMLGALIFAALPLTTLAGEHIEVDMVYGLSPAIVRMAMRVIGGGFSALVLWAIAWRLAAHAVRLVADGSVTNALAIPLAPLGWFAAASAALSGVLALLRMLAPVGQASAE